MRRVISYLFVAIVISSIFGCGSESTSSKVDKKNRNYFLTKDNFVSIAKYSYMQKMRSIKRGDHLNDINHNSRFRTSPALASSEENSKNSLKVTVINQDNSLIKVLNIKSKYRDILLNIQNDNVLVTLSEDGKEIKKESLNINQFSSFKLDGFGE